MSGQDKKEKLQKIESGRSLYSKNNFFNMKDYLLNILLKILNRHGILGLISFVGGFIIIAFVRNSEIKKQIIVLIIGSILLIYSGIIYWSNCRYEYKKDRDIIFRLREISVSLAHKLDREMSNEQIVSITQTIADTQKELIGILGSKKYNEQIKKNKKG